jgi:hypothetical protein
MCHAEDQGARLAGPKGQAMETRQIELIVADPTPSGITRLREEQTPAAHEALLKIALNQRLHSDFAKGAARGFVLGLTNKLAGTRLFQSINPEIHEIGLEAMIGCSPDAAAWGELKRLLESTNVNVRRLVAIVLREARDQLPGKEKAEALAHGMRGIEALPGADKKLGDGNLHVQLPLYDFTFGEFARAFIHMPGAEIDILRALTPQEPGMARDTMIVARAWNKDVTILAELRRVSRDSPLVHLRWLALGAFTVVGSAEDLSFLEEVATQDPLEVKRYVDDTANPDWNPVLKQIFPLRERAKEVADRIRKSQPK